MPKAWVVRSAAALAVLLASTACTGDSDDGGSTSVAEVSRDFVTRPDLTPPRIDITTTEAGEEADLASDGAYVFLAPKDKQEQSAPMNGPLIVDGDGDPVWVHPLGDTRWSYDFRVQEYQGEPVLTWWRGDTHPYGFGEGEFVVMDQSYEPIATVTTPGTHADFHEMTLTSDGTALLLSFPRVEHDLTEFGGPSDGYIRNCVVHEIDVDTGKELFRWSALEHIPMNETKAELEVDDEEDAESGSKEAPFDPYHFNSVTQDGTTGLIVSARNTHALYRIDTATGQLDWTLGGEGSDFEAKDDSQFAWQHDAHRRADGTITLFDNEAAPPVGDEARGLRLDIDEGAATVSVNQEFPAPDGWVSDSQGNMQVLDSGRVLIGWGSEPHYSEFTADGELLYDAELAGGQSYRTYRFPWVGEPTEPPRFVLEDGAAYVSWNGATEVDSWRFMAGYDRKSAQEVATVSVDGFETSSEMPDAAYIAAQALDDSGKVLATATPGDWP